MILASITVVCATAIAVTEMLLRAFVRNNPKNQDVTAKIEALTEEVNKLKSRVNADKLNRAWS
jgi:hypothetical protein